MPDITDQYTGPALKEKRRAALMTQAQLAEKVGVNAITVNHWERGRKRPSLKHVQTLQTLLKSE